MDTTLVNSEEIRTRYQSDGFVFPVDVLSPSEATSYRERLETIEQQYRPTLPVERYLKFDPHYLLPLIDELVRLPRLLDLAATFLGPDLLISNTNIFLKEPNSPDHVTWHQDMRYIGLDGDDFLTVWLAFSSATEENGCMQFLQGSHRERMEHHDTYGENNMLTRGQSIVDDIEPARIANVLLEPGQASIHHGWMAARVGPQSFG